MNATAILRSSAGLIALPLTFGTCAQDDAPAGIAGVLREVRTTTPSGRWTDLLHPIDLAVASPDTIYVADLGDKRVKLFDGDGRPLGALGREGGGPGELRSIQDLALLDGEVVVLDAQLRRLVRLGTDGAFSGVVPNAGLEDLIAGAGPRSMILANSAAWNVPVAGGQEPWPLFRVIDVDGRELYQAGRRSYTGNPFVDHVRNFVLPAASPDGRWVWLARLNDPTVELYSAERAAFRSIGRRLAFDWRRIPDDFTPSSAQAAAVASLPAPPFDVVSLAIAADARGRAYVLTALGPTDDAAMGPREVAVDVLSPGDAAVRRYIVPAPATHIAVSPAGDRIYLLDEPTAAIRVYRPEDTDAR